ncbi:MAG: tellurite resistance TerB family protein [Petrimonas sp.]|nr:tellurite resistance TerB family protein [Petrimonas sp.]
MALFDKFPHKHQKTHDDYIPESDYEAWIGILYACVSADGDDSNTEIESLSRMIAMKQKFSRIDILPLYERVEEIHAKIGGAALITACAKMVDESDKDTLFSMAVEIVLADGILDEKEEKTIEFIAQQMAIAQETVDKIVEVMLIRNRGNLIMLD